MPHYSQEELREWGMRSVLPGVCYADGGSASSPGAPFPVEPAEHAVGVVQQARQQASPLVGV